MKFFHRHKWLLVKGHEASGGYARWLLYVCKDIRCLKTGHQEVSPNPDYDVVTDRTSWNLITFTDLERALKNGV